MTRLRPASKRWTAHQPDRVKDDLGLRRKARITYDEITRVIKGVQAAGLPIARVNFDGDRIEVVIGQPMDSGPGDQHKDAQPTLLREPKL